MALAIVLKVASDCRHLRENHYSVDLDKRVLTHSFSGEIS